MEKGKNTDQTCKKNSAIYDENTLSKYVAP